MAGAANVRGGVCSAVPKRDDMVNGRRPGIQRISISVDALAADVAGPVVALEDCLGGEGDDVRAAEAPSSSRSVGCPSVGAASVVAQHAPALDRADEAPAAPGLPSHRASTDSALIYNDCVPGGEMLLVVVSGAETARSDEFLAATLIALLGAAALGALGHSYSFHESFMPPAVSAARGFLREGVREDAGAPRREEVRVDRGVLRGPMAVRVDVPASGRPSGLRVPRVTSGLPRARRPGVGPRRAVTRARLDEGRVLRLSAARGVLATGLLLRLHALAGGGVADVV